MTQWLAARARNALRRPLRIIGISATAFLAMLLTLILIPRDATRTAARLLEGTSVRPDTAMLAQRVAHLELRWAAADTTTVRHRTHADSVHHALLRAVAALDSARQRDMRLDARVEEAHVLARESAPPLALMAAALVLGVALGFLVTFANELATPRVSDAAEVTRIAGVPTLATIGPRSPEPERMRRRADRDVPPLIHLNTESYRYLYTAVSDAASAAAFGFPLIAVTGDEPEVVGTVAANIAVAGVHDSRTALLIDADPDAAMIAGIVGVARSPGVSDVLAGRADWAEITVAAVVGRDRSLSVMPAGSTLRALEALATPALPAAPPSAGSGLPGVTATSLDTFPETGEPAPAADADVLQAALLRLGRRYDLIVVAAPAGAAQVGPQSILPVHHAIICVRVAFTPLERLAEATAALRESGLVVRGVVLWNADVPPRLTAA